MSPELIAVARRELAAPVPDPIQAAAQDLARGRGACAALFYGSILRTGDLSGVVDFYLLTAGPHRRGLRALAERWLWPEVSYHQIECGGSTLRAKVATMPLALFRRAAEGRTFDTTIWTRFVQPAALAWAADEAVGQEVTACIASACETAGRFAAVLGPARGPARAFWSALFRETYRAELRIEPPGRETQILDFDPERYAALLPLAWASAGVPFKTMGGQLQPEPAREARRALISAWRRRRRVGKALNAARLMKAVFTFEGAARYAAWKIERHTGVQIPVTPWRERHPILAAPGVMWRLWRARWGQREAR